MSERTQAIREPEGCFYDGEYVRVHGLYRFGNATLQNDRIPIEHAAEYPDGPEEYARVMDLDPEFVKAAVKEYEDNWTEILWAECRARDWVAGYYAGCRSRDWVAGATAGQPPSAGIDTNGSPETVRASETGEPNP